MSKKSFLVPIVAAIAALTSSPSFSAQHKISDASSDPMTSKNSDSLQGTSERMIQMVRGTELHDLILKSSESGQTYAYHSSHRSHSSHQSHSSHYSSR
jgi:hypothetical protein